MLNQVQFRYKRSTELLASTSIIQYGKFKILHEIMPALERHGVLQDFAAICFGCFLNSDANTLFSSKLVHNLLAKEIVVDGVGDDELYFGVGGRRLSFSKYEFCLLTGLKFEGRAHFSAYNNRIVEGGVLQRYWPNGKIDVVSLQTRLYEQDANFTYRKDPLKMALVLFVERFLFGADYRKTGLDDLYFWLHLLQSWRSRMEKRKKDHAPQSDSPVPYVEGKILPTG